MNGFLPTDPYALGFVLAAVSAVCWASFDISRKHIGTSMSATAAVAGVMLFHAPFIVPFIGATELMGMPKGSSPLAEIVFIGVPSMTGDYAMLAGGSIALNLLANLLFLRSVQISPLSLSTPYLAFTPVFSAVPAFLVYNEVPTTWGFAGILTVCLGAFFLNPGNRSHGWAAPLWALWKERGSLYMLIVAALWSITPVLDKGAAVETSAMWHTLVLSFGVAIIFLGGRVLRDRGASVLVEEISEEPFWVAASGLFAVGAMVLQLASYEYIDVAYVETIKRAVGVMGSIVAGWMLFDESDIARRLLGAAVMTAGVAMVILGG